MASGGARQRPGPAPDPNSLRSLNRRDGYTTLPRAFDGPMPAWPLAVGSVRERKLWVELWGTPQAAAWHAANLWPNDVALYVRLSLAAEDGDLKAASEARQWSDRLGLNLDAMERKRWRVELPGADSPQPVAETPAVETMSQRMRRQLGES